MTKGNVDEGNVTKYIVINDYVNVIWDLYWGGSRHTKPCLFPYKVAATGDKRYLACATGAAAVVSCAN